VKYFLSLALALLAGCEAPSPTGKIKYTKLTVTDVRGDLIAEWVAEGRVKKTDLGYDIQAVERKSGPPYSVSMRYPNRRFASVVGPNIVLEEVEKPDWVQKLDADVSPAVADHSR
jgi:hypothetical protein